MTLTGLPQPELRGSACEGSKGSEGRDAVAASSPSPPSSASRDILSGDYLRDDWKPIPGTPFHEGSRGGDDGLRRVLEMVSAAVRMD